MLPLLDRPILVIEDDQVLASHLKASLENHDFQVTLANSGDDGLNLALERRFELIVLDVMLPGMDGMEVLSRMRRQRRTPVVMISALGQEQDRISGFDRGADDYLPKPFSVNELRVRMEAVLRRVAYERQLPELQPPSGLLLDEQRCDLACHGRWAGLTSTEYRLLDLLFRHAGEVLSKPFLYQQVLRRGYARHDRALDMHVSNIRRKLDLLAADGIRIESVWGKGYVLNRNDA